MNLQHPAHSQNPSPVLVVGGSGGVGYQMALSVARDWSQDEVVDWGRARIVMSEQPADGQLGIRDLRATLNLKPGGLQVVILNLDGAGIEVQNALLKRFEEPPSDTWIIALASGLGHILPTIRSRCQIIKTNNPSEAEIQAWIQENYPEVNPEIAKMCGNKLDCIAWAANNTQAAEAAAQGAMPVLLSHIKESDSAAYETEHILHLLNAAGHCHIEQARQILRTGSKPEAALALASLSRLKG